MDKKIFFLLTMLFTVSIAVTQAQCLNCDPSSSASGDFSTAIGHTSTASGFASFAAGAHSKAIGSATISLGLWNLNTTDAYYSTTIGSYCKTTANSAMVLGAGISENNYLTNGFSYSLMVGFNSDKPTLFVSHSNGPGYTGRIGIGNVTNPQAKLHLRADDGEYAAIFIEPNNWGAYEEAGLALGNLFHGITAKSSVGLQFHTQLYYTFNEGNVGIGTDKPTYTLHVIGSTFTNMFTLFDEHNPPQNGMVLVSDEAGNANWADPANVSLWKVNPNNGVDLYFPERVAGNVGIGTINTYGYRLAVNGKILTDEVMVKDPVDWFDYVLKPEYKLMPLNELEIFINQNSHLPDVPSKAEVAENGYGLAEMNGILLKKVEELTLYIIEQKKAIEEQQDEIKKMKEFIGIRND